ncbi:hypothetical protein BpHYR1_037828, partial [Brachionus plicatilis]
LINSKELHSLNSVVEKWRFVSDHFLSILDSIALLKKLNINIDNQLPWYDDELVIVKYSRDLAYKKQKKSGLDSDKEFLSDKIGDESSMVLKCKNKTIDDKQEISNIFNNFFTTVMRTSLCMYSVRCAVACTRLTHIILVLYCILSGDEEEILGHLVHTSGIRRLESKCCEEDDDLTLETATVPHTHSGCARLGVNFVRIVESRTTLRLTAAQDVKSSRRPDKAARRGVAPCTG